MSKLGNIYGEHELPRLFPAPFHRGQQLVKVYIILLPDSVMLLAIVMTIWALSTAVIWGLVIHQRDSESWNGQLGLHSSTSNHACCEATELSMRHGTNKRRAQRLRRPHHAHHPHRPN
ncbi:hypothetical protein ASPFODRAFT_53666 [Aspergillus luchuensis CBS 106.47]|uniref:Uncharacterized protein n=1 Tax=Aspergillus luchuensis (strain CBS 106.47) TaxID=1137211 RepID=A0A1M3T0L1_ASPLC|nr:hypothetical protein ASPFODRAFT_53666 [Aspergillus luchuensis CBS 106.47]